MIGDSYYCMQISSTTLSQRMIQENLTHKPLAYPQGFVLSVHSIHQSGMRGRTKLQLRTKPHLQFFPEHGSEPSISI